MKSSLPWTAQDGRNGVLRSAEAHSEKSKLDLRRSALRRDAECLDHVIILGEAHLRQVLKACTAYHNATRTHLGIEKDAPNRRSIERSGVIVANAVLGGLHHRYARI